MSGRVRLRPNRGFPRRIRLRRHPLKSFIRVDHDLRGRWHRKTENARREKFNPWFGRREMIKQSGREFVEMMLLGEAKREDPVRTEPHPPRSFYRAGGIDPGRTLNAKRRMPSATNRWLGSVDYFPGSQAQRAGVFAEDKWDARPQ